VLTIGMQWRVRHFTAQYIALGESRGKLPETPELIPLT